MSAARTPEAEKAFPASAAAWVLALASVLLPATGRLEVFFGEVRP